MVAQQPPLLPEAAVPAVDLEPGFFDSFPLLGESIPFRARMGHGAAGSARGPGQGERTTAAAFPAEAAAHLPPFILVGASTHRH